MPAHHRFFIQQIILGLMLLLSLNCYAIDFSGHVGVQQRVFTSSPLDESQVDVSTSIHFEPEWYESWNDGADSITFTPFFRHDTKDDERSDVDIRELYWLHVQNDWELGVGISKVYWGVTESQHLVDIVNQTDFIDAPDGEEKLGQPMVRWSNTNQYGVVDLFILPGFRERTFAGERGRLRSQTTVDADHPTYESSDEEKHVDFAVRWANSIGGWDLGASYFDGTSREPEFVTTALTDTINSLRPHYPLITQLGIDVQLTSGAWLWKLEAISRDSKSTDFEASTGGFEYTFYNLFNGLGDFGAIAEYSYDSRDELAGSGMQNDIFVGGRFAWNDAASSQLLVGLVQDLDVSGSHFAKFEANTRFGDATKVYLNAWLFASDNSMEPSYSIRKDDFIELSVEYYF